MGNDKGKGLNKKGLRSSGSLSSTNDEALARLMVSEMAMLNESVIGMKKEERLAFLEIKMRDPPSPKNIDRMNKTAPNQIQNLQIARRQAQTTFSNKLPDSSMIDMIPNGVFRAEFNVNSIINKMREGRLRWFGHVKRRPETAHVRRAEAMLVEGSRRRGRPKLRWEDRLKQDMKELLLSEDMTSDRNVWRDRIRISG
ncbi:hypothetical protein Tco_0696700 [Tanacetum coccineum]